MGLPSIKDKLERELKKEIKEESQVVYILSRIRKILEIDRKKKKYKVLKLYCDWALHSEIEDTNPIRDLLEGVASLDDVARLDFILFVPFHKDLKKFLEEYDLPQEIYSNRMNKGMFNKFLSQIYTDTPLVIKDVVKRTITWKDNTDPFSSGPSRGGSFSVT